MKAMISLMGALVAVSLLGMGCQTTIIDSNTHRTATYCMGKLTTHVPNDIATVYGAGEKAMTSLNLNVTQKFQDKLEAKLVGRDAQDKKISLELTAPTADSTNIAIHTWSREKAQRLNEAIQANLPK
jgi:hypothetical protein